MATSMSALDDYGTTDYLLPTSNQDRYSRDMRFFKCGDIPVRVHPKIAQDALLSVRAFAATPW